MQLNNNLQSNQSLYFEPNKSLQRIATALAVNQASDNPSTQAVADILRTQSNGYVQSLSNVNSAVASVQIADGAMNEQSRILDKVNERLLQAANGTTSQEGREAILKDVKALMKNFDDIASNTSYNGQTLLQNSSSDKSPSSVELFQIGNNSQDTVSYSSIQSNSEGLGLSDLASQDANSFDTNKAREFLGQVKNAMDGLNSYRGELGSVQNQLESSGRNLLSQQVQTTQAQAELVGANIPQEISSFNKQNILSQVGSYVQSQSNSMQQNVLRLLA
ncbi:MAG: flagellin [Arcobacteraceae bacterium]|nr:flagellin [Arcobacteraceae bacterium]